MARDARESRSTSQQAVRITTAAQSREADIKARQKRYLLSMSLRSACFIGATTVFLTTGPGIFVWILVAGAIALPYVAVVMANATSRKADGFALVQGVPNRPQLSPGTSRPGVGPADRGPEA